jgi:hypothetical protein
MTLMLLAVQLAAISQSNYNFRNATLISGTALSVNAVYRFSNVKTGVDARVTISAITGGIQLTSIDGGGGFDRALQPVLNVPGQKNGYVEPTIRFYVAGTTTLQTQTEVPITPIDVDGQTYGSLKLFEFDEIDMPNGYTYFQYAGSELDMSFNGTWARGKNTTGVDYGGIDTVQKTVMFTTVNANINTIRVRVGCDNQSNSTASRLRSLYFQRFDYPFEVVLPNRTLLSFSGAEKNEKVVLKGNLSASHTYDKILVERSANGSYFEILGELPITNGGSAEFPFTYVDQSPILGNNFYRIRLLNTPQAIQEISNTLMVKTNLDGNQKLQVYNSIVKLSDPSITLQSAEDTDAVFDIADMSGRVVYTRKTKLYKGVNLVDLTSLRAGSGYYVLVGRTQTGVIKHKMIFQ